MLSYVVTGFSLGLNAGVIPGPTQTYLIQSVLAWGWRRVIVSAFAPLVADGPLVLLSVLVLAQLPDVVLRLLRIGGGVFILWLAFSTLRGIRAGALLGSVQGEGAGLTPRQLFFRVVVINMLNPGAWVFWASINGPLLVEGLRESWLSGLAFLVSFYTGLIGFLCLIVLAFGWLRRLDARATRALMLIATTILAVLGVSFIVQGITG